MYAAVNYGPIDFQKTCILNSLDVAISKQHFKKRFHGVSGYFLHCGDKREMTVDYVILDKKTGKVRVAFVVKTSNRPEYLGIDPVVTLQEQGIHEIFILDCFYGVITRMNLTESGMYTVISRRSYMEVPSAEITGLEVQTGNLMQ